MLGIEDLIEQLGDRDAKSRRTAAEALGRIGMMARDAIPALLRCAMDVDAGVRKAAVEVLPRIVPDWPKSREAAMAMPILIKGLSSRITEVWQSATYLLRQMGATAVPALLEILSDREQDTRQVIAARVLGQIGPEAVAAVAGLVKELACEKTHVRQGAAEALAAIGQTAEPAVPALVNLLADWNPQVRQAAAKSLARVGHAAGVAVPALIQLLTDREDEVRESAVQALAQIGADTVPSLMEFLQTVDVQHMEEWLRLKLEGLQLFTEVAEQLKQGGVVALPYRPDERTLDAIRREPLKAMRNATWAFRHAVDDSLRVETAREAAVRVLGKIGPQAVEAVSTLLAMLADKNRQVRLTVLRTLGEIGRPAQVVIPQLVQMLVDPVQAMRKAAAEALPKIDPAWALDARVQSTIAGFVEDLKRAAETGQMASEALVRVGSPCLPYLIKAMSSSDRVQRENAATTLGRIGPEAREAIPALNNALQDGHGWVRDAATRAIQLIDPQKK